MSTEYRVHSATEVFVLTWSGEVAKVAKPKAGTDSWPDFVERVNAREPEAIATMLWAALHEHHGDMPQPQVAILIERMGGIDAAAYHLGMLFRKFLLESAPTDQLGVM